MNLRDELFEIKTNSIAAREKALREEHIKKAEVEKKRSAASVTKAKAEYQQFVAKVKEDVKRNPTQDKITLGCLDREYADEIVKLLCADGVSARTAWRRIPSYTDTDTGQHEPEYLQYYVEIRLK